jgi:hypothetical protein
MDLLNDLLIALLGVCVKEINQCAEKTSKLCSQ